MKSSRLLPETIFFPCSVNFQPSQPECMANNESRRFCMVNTSQTRFCIVGFLLLLLMPHGAGAAPALEITDLKHSYELSPYLDLLEDKTRTLTISDVTSDTYASRFTPNRQRYPKFNFSTSVYWGRIRIHNASYQTGWIMTFLSSTMGAIDQADLYISDPNGDAGEYYQYVFMQGDSLFESEKPQPGDNAVFDLHIPADSEITLYFRIQDEALTLLHLYLYNPVVVFQINEADKLFDVAQFSLVLFFVFNVLLFLSLKDRIFLISCLIIFSEGVYYALPEITGLSTWWMNRLRWAAYLVNALTWIFVVKAFYQNLAIARPLNRVLHGFLCLFGIMIVSFFVLPFHLVTKASAWLFIFYASLLMALSLFSWVKKLTTARYLSIGMIFLALSWFGIYFDLLGYLSLSFWHLVYLKALKSIVVFSFFSFALLDRYKFAEDKMLQNQATALKQMQQADELKDDFLANTSHELRTPLHGIIGLSEDLLAKDARPSETEWKESIALIIKSGKRLSKLIDDILDFSKIKLNDLELSPKPVDFKSIAALVVTLCRPMIGKKPIAIRTVLAEPLPVVKADEDRLQQILLNLLGNAIKFTHNGEITLSAGMVEDRFTVSIADTGIGIPDEKRDSIFSEFHQVDGSIQREYGGTGLGLAITRKLVELQGGTIRVESVAGKGSKFIFTLPVAEETDTAEGKIRPYVEATEIVVQAPDSGSIQVRKTAISGPGHGGDSARQILIVDDDAIGLFTLERLLVSAGYGVAACQDGETAWEKIKKERFDLVVLDIMMPRMNGYEVCEKIRTRYDLSQLPVVMLTARNQSEDMIKGFDSGANDFVTKPVNREELLSRIQTSLKLKQYTDLLRENHVLKEEILKRKRVEKDLTSVNQRLVGLLDIWEAGIIVVDGQQKIQFFNQRAESLFGCDSHDAYDTGIQSLLPDIAFPENQVVSQQVNMAVKIQKKDIAFPMEVLITPIQVKGENTHALICRKAADANENNSPKEIADALTRTHQKIQILQSAFDSALQFLDREGRQMVDELKNIESAMADEFEKLPKTEIEPLFRRTIVDTMAQVLEAWERATGKNKIAFAEESRLWRVYLDGDAHKTRTLDKYTDIRRLPKNPRWKDVIKSVEFVLCICTDKNPMKTELHASLTRLRALARAR